MLYNFENYYEGYYMLSKKIKKFKTMKLVSDFTTVLLVFAYLMFLFLLLIPVNIGTIIDGNVSRFIFSGFSILISAFAFIKIMDYMSKSKIWNFNKYFNREEVVNYPHLKERACKSQQI